MGVNELIIGCLTFNSHGSGNISGLTSCLHRKFIKETKCDVICISLQEFYGQPAKETRVLRSPLVNKLETFLGKYNYKSTAYEYFEGPGKEGIRGIYILLACLQEGVSFKTCYIYVNDPPSVLPKNTRLRNKGACAVRVTYPSNGPVLTFISAHLPFREKCSEGQGNKERNAVFKFLDQYLELSLLEGDKGIFSNNIPKSVRYGFLVTQRQTKLPRVAKSPHHVELSCMNNKTISCSMADVIDIEEPTECITSMKSSHIVFWMGDLNYRMEGVPNDWWRQPDKRDIFYRNDGLTNQLKSTLNYTKLQESRLDRILPSTKLMTWNSISSEPETRKRDRLKLASRSSEPYNLGPYKTSVKDTIRVPSITDRILWKARANKSVTPLFYGPLFPSPDEFFEAANQKTTITDSEYAIKKMAEGTLFLIDRQDAPDTSDHMPVVGIFKVSK